MTKWVKFLLIANVVIFFFQMTNGAFTETFAFRPVLFFRQPWTIVTYMFLHGGIGHLFFNMLGLFFFGSRVEDRLGSNRFITLYFLSGITGALFGFIFPAYHLLPELDALENVCLPARLGRMAGAVAEARGRELLQRVGLGARLEHKPYELSGGEQQRVAIARALINAPDLILADEPTGNLDSHTGEEIIELLCALRAEKQTALVIATHDAKVAIRAPQVLELVDGLMQGEVAARQNSPEPR